MICEDICHIIATYLSSLRDIISFHNVNQITHNCIFNISLYVKRQIPDFIYNQFNITKICSSFTDYSNIPKLLTDKLLYLSVSHIHKNNDQILYNLRHLTNLRSLRIYSYRLTDRMIHTLHSLTSLDCGYCESNHFDGSCLTNMKNLTFLNLSKSFIDSKYINDLTELRYLFINTRILSNDFINLTKLKTLDVSTSDYTIGDSNISNLTELTVLRCKYSVISSIDHLVNLEVLHIGLNYTLHSITNSNLKSLSIINANVSYLDVPNLLELTAGEYITDSIIKNHTNLTCLILGANTCITDDGIKPLYNLNYLHCNNNYNITENSVVGLMKLKYIHIGKSNIDYTKLNHLPNLRYAEMFNPELINLESIIVIDNRYS